MSRIDLSKLRKRAGMSQRELASLLQVRPSFLSAIENGRSRLPEEKQEKIKEIFALDSLEEYMIDDLADVVVPPHTHVPPHSHDGDASIPPHIHSSPSTQSDAITQLLNHFQIISDSFAESLCFKKLPFAYEEIALRSKIHRNIIYS